MAGLTSIVGKALQAILGPSRRVSLIVLLLELNCGLKVRMRLLGVLSEIDDLAIIVCLRQVLSGSVLRSGQVGD